MSNYRTPEQLEEMQRLEEAGICLFCPEALDKRAQQRTLLKTEHWTVTPNEFPYKGTKLHLLVIPHEHVNDMLDLDGDSLNDFWKTLKMVRKQFNLTHYGLGARNGDCAFTGATIAHVHAHLLVGDPEPDPEVPVRMRFSSRPSRLGAKPRALCRGPPRSSRCQRSAEHCLPLAQSRDRRSSIGGTLIRR